MGFFSRFKKSKDESTQQPPPRYTSPEYPSFDLEYSSGDVATVEFQGIIEVEGKQLHNVAVTYTASNSKFTQERILLEPLYGENNGQRVDVTASHYARLGRKPDEYSTTEEKRGYNAVKGFFQKQQIQDIIENESGSNYMGYLSYNSQGRACRAYDNNFKGRYAAIYQAREAAKKAKINERIAAEQASVEATRESLMAEGLQQQLIRQTYGYGKEDYDKKDYDAKGYARKFNIDDKYGEREPEER